MKQRISDDPHIHLAVIAGAKNRLLDVLIEKLESNRISVFKIEQQMPHLKWRISFWIAHLVSAIVDFCEILKKKCSVVAFHYLTPRSVLLAFLLNAFNVKYVIHFWGSDYYYWEKRNNPLLRVVLRNAKYVTFANSQILDQAKCLWGIGNCKVLRFGLEAIDLIDESKCGYRKNGLVRVVVGTNCHVNQQHLAIIDAIEKIPKRLIEDVVFVFPLNYGYPMNKRVVINRLSSASFKYEVVEKYMMGKELADFRLGTHVLIQVQKTDAMSGAMLETLYAGGKVLTGTWLPYYDLRNEGVDWFEVDTVSDITVALPLALLNEIDRRKNKEIVSRMAHWREQTPMWVECYTR